MSEQNSPAHAGHFFIIILNSSSLWMLNPALSRLVV
jgi:hypothetical protein